ncbi:hypothetical protein S7711_02601 [Stachybotrys chartarum IBT 7711]|uniref:Acetylserotonin methytransferase-like protein n=1 Tax=Stachybotrys chartarum (strain CBS 109288 / IBT 7711) TaxID=1280523 RepID=A0A084B8X9_STACB|nr:hypothetical protein S7711_02601 [Stachybotrys chartarum IBT 7711]KFA56263.1 hypothetical protein S40293_00217 [Stachybotrys chartarum IBT 40293]
MSSSQQQQPPSGGLSLFPSPNASKPPPMSRFTPQARRSESRERRAPTPQDHHRRALTPQTVSPVSPDETPQMASPPRNGRQTPQSRTQSPVETRPRFQEPPAWPLTGQQQTQPQRQQQNRPADVVVQQPRQLAEVPVRTETALSQANTLVRDESTRSRSSIAKLPLDDDPSSSSQPMRSIFPTYNPEVPLDQQNYAPTQLSPTRVPRAVISRQEYHGDMASPRSQNPRSPLRSPLSAEPNNQWPRRAAEPPVIPQPCTTEQLKSLWKVTNGWKASSSEGRVFCMRMTQLKDAPVYTLSSSANHPFYNIRLDPTSASAYVTVTKLDPSKPWKAPKTDPNGSTSSLVGSSSSSKRASDSKHWQEALNTTLEEESRKHPPNDGLVALLMPTPAMKMALEKSNDPQALAVAERECARLVWDEDSSNHFLVHPALAKPFCVTIERSPAWSRIEYTLEHHESPQHIAKLTRDGTGGGWLEVDTGIASKIESFYIIDVAVTALMLVAAADEKNLPAVAEAFEPPPPPPAMIVGKDPGRLSKFARREDKKKRKMQEFEIDVESQDDSIGKKSKAKEAEDKLPFVLRVVVKLTKGVFKCFIWILTLLFKMLKGVFGCFYKCLGSKY